MNTPEPDSAPTSTPAGEGSNLKQNLVAAGKIGGVMLVAVALLVLYVLIVLTTQLG